MPRKYDLSQYMAARKKRTILSAAIIFALVPLTIYAGIRFLGDRKYLLMCMLILIYTMAPFFISFERRKPRAREIVMIAVMAALTALGNFCCYMIAPFQAGTAMVIISGIALGPEAGFLTGALARFVCNFFAGHGPWSPWQMFCWGIIGFLSGLIFNKVELDKLKSRSFQIVQGPVLCIAIAEAVGYLSWYLAGEGQFIGWRLYVFGAVGMIAGLLIQRKRLPIDDVTLCIYGFMATFIIYGGIMNIATMVMASEIPDTGITISWQSLVTLYISGAPYDFSHALGTAFFLFVMGDRVIRKVERVKIKYGFYR